MGQQLKNFLDLDNISLYDQLIKEYIGDEDASAYKTILLSVSGETAYFYKKKNAILGTDTPDVTISLTGTGTRVTLNGVDSGSSVSFYAPTTAGTQSQVLISNGSGAPSWGNLYGYTPSYDSENNKLIFTRSSL